MGNCFYSEVYIILTSCYSYVLCEGRHGGDYDTRAEAILLFELLYCVVCVA